MRYIAICVLIFCFSIVTGCTKCGCECRKIEKCEKHECCHDKK